MPTYSASLILKDILFFHNLNYKLCEARTHIGAFAVPKIIGSCPVTSYVTLR